MKLPALFWGIALVFCGCASDVHPNYNDLHKELQAQLQTVIIEDGIDQHEANIIAQSYFLRFFPGCGMANNVEDTGEFWTAKTGVGIAGTPGEPIQIDKHTGKVTCKDHPTIESPKTIFN